MMSIRIMTAVWDDKTTKGSERLVLLALADSANDEGFCWPSLETIAKKCNINRRFVIRLIEQLEEKGLIERERRTKDGLYTSNMYRVIVHKVVNISTPPAGNNRTPPSEPPFTGVVNPESLKPPVNPNRTIKNQQEEERRAQLATVSKAYEKEIGGLTSMITDTLTAALEDYPVDWIVAAFGEAALNNARNWKYAEAILKRWKRDGFQSVKKDSATRRKDGASQPVRRTGAIERMKQELANGRRS